MNYEALKRAINTVQVKREAVLESTLARLRETVRTGNRTIEDDKDFLRLRKQIDAKVTAYNAAIYELLQLKAEIDGTHAKTLQKVEELHADAMKQKKRRAKTSKENPRSTKDEGFVDWNDVFREIDKRIISKKNPMTQGRAIAQVIANKNAIQKNITINAESVGRKYRNWKANRPD